MQDQNSGQPSTGRDALDEEIIESGWRARHELLLLQLIQTQGFGNWQAIAVQMRRTSGINRSKEEIQFHYFSCYLQAPPFLPALLDQSHPQSRLIFVEGQGEEDCTCPHPLKREDFLSIDLLFSTKANLALLGSPDHQFSSIYNPKRHELSIELDQEAEFLITDLSFNQDDTPIEIEYKLSVIEEYNARVGRRDRVKDWAIEHRLLEKGYQKLAKVLRRRDEVAAEREFKGLTRFMGLAEYTELIGKIVLLRRLRKTMIGLSKLKNSRRAKSDLLGMSRKQVHLCQGKKPGKKMKPAPEQLKEAQCKFQLLLRQELGLSVKESKKLVRMIGMKDYKRVEAAFQGAQFLLPS